MFGPGNFGIGPTTLDCDVSVVVLTPGELVIPLVDVSAPLTVPAASMSNELVDINPFLPLTVYG